MKKGFSKKKSLFILISFTVLMIIVWNYYSSVDEDLYDIWSIKSIEINDKDILNSFLMRGSNIITFNHDGSCRLPIYLEELADGEANGKWSLNGIKKDILKIRSTNSYFNTDFKIIKFDRHNLILGNEKENKKVVCFRL